MIEIRNYIVCDKEEGLRGHTVDTVDYIVCDNKYNDDMKAYTVKIDHPSSQTYARFDSPDKALAFYEALKALLPDSPDKLQTIDHKDFEC